MQLKRFWTCGNWEKKYFNSADWHLLLPLGFIPALDYLATKKMGGRVQAVFYPLSAKSNNLQWKLSKQRTGHIQVIEK